MNFTDSKLSESSWTQAERSGRFHLEILEEVELSYSDRKQISGCLGQAQCWEGGGWGNVDYKGASRNLPER